MNTTHYAGFWNRFAALFIDALLLMIPQAVFGYLVSLAFVNRMASLDPVQNYLGFTLWSKAIALGIAWLYFGLMESSHHQATVGKMLLGIVVTDVSGRRVTFARASGRFFGKLASSIIFGIGYIMAGFTSRKQALHDMMASCLVVKRGATSTNDIAIPEERIPIMPPPVPSQASQFVTAAIALCRKNPLIPLGALLGVGILSVMAGLFWYNHVYWTTVSYGGHETFAITFQAGNGQYLYKGINKMRCRNGTIEIYHFKGSRRPEVIYQGMLGYQVYKDSSRWPSWTFPDRQEINLTELQQKEKDKEQRMKDIYDRIGNTSR